MTDNIGFSLVASCWFPVHPLGAIRGSRYHVPCTIGWGGGNFFGLSNYWVFRVENAKQFKMYVFKLVQTVVTCSHFTSLSKQREINELRVLPVLMRLTNRTFRYDI